MVVSHCDEPGIARKMLEGGACGYLLKRSSPSLLFEAIYGVADDQGGWLSPSLSQSLFTESTALEQVHGRLTVREQETLSFVGKGFQNAEIADHLHRCGHRQKPRASHPSKVGTVLPLQTHCLGAPA